MFGKQISRLPNSSKASTACDAAGERTYVAEKNFGKKTTTSDIRAVCHSFFPPFKSTCFSPCLSNLCTKASTAAVSEELLGDDPYCLGDFVPQKDNMFRHWT